MNNIIRKNNIKNVHAANKKEETMHNKYLDTFLKVAEMGSFSKAAALMYITPSAVIQQMNNLEGELQTRLFVRTKQGITLTETGALLYKRGCELVRISKEIRREIQTLNMRDQREVTIGTTLLHKCRLLYELWMHFQGTDMYYYTKMIDMTSDEKQYFNVDIIEGVKDGECWQEHRNFLELCTVPIACAVSKKHFLAGKKLLTYDDMKGETLVTVELGMSQALDSLREEAEKRGVTVLDVKKYDLSVFSMCIMNGYMLQIPACWRDIHSDMITIPCEWDYALPYGIFYKEKSSKPVQEFVEFVEKLCERENFHVY